MQNSLLTGNKKVKKKTGRVKFLIGVLLMSASTCIAQNDSALSFHKKLITIIADKDEPGSVNIPFKDVNIWDVRADTTSIGFLKRNNVVFSQVDFTKGLANEINVFSKKTFLFNSEDTNTLIVIIKNFRVSDFATVADVDNNNLVKWNSGIFFNAELFSFNGKGYHALYKIDTVFTSEKKFLVENIPPDIFHILFYKVENKKITELHTGKTAFSFQQMQDHVNNFYNFPILTDKTLQRGVYKTFNEFKNNQPSVESFQTKSGNLSDELYITENNQTFVLQDYWGYCDGRNLYIHSADNNFQLYRIGNTFNTKAFKSLNKQKPVGNAVAHMLLTPLPFLAVPHKGPDKYKVLPEAFQLDMQTGEMY
jgi:hypothetical protein